MVSTAWLKYLCCMWEGRDAVVLTLTLKTQLSGQYRYVFVGISVTVSASQVSHPPPHFCGGMLLVMMEPRHYGTPLLLLLLPGTTRMLFRDTHSLCLSYYLKRLP